MDEIQKELIEQSSGVLKEAYKDIVRPSAEPVGVMLSLLPRTIRLGLQKWERWIINGEESLRLTESALREKVKIIPEENLCVPEPYVAIPAIQQISYCYDSEDLRNLYANLLASSMNVDTKNSVHPGYVDIIKQLTPDEAKILNGLPPIASVYHPIVDIIRNLGEGRGDIEIVRNYTTVGNEICDNPENIGQYFDNLSRLKLVSIPEDRHLMDDRSYDEIRNAKSVKSILEQPTPEGTSYSLRKKYFYVTDFGVGFMKCCLDRRDVGIGIKTENEQNMD